MKSAATLRYKLKRKNSPIQIPSYLFASESRNGLGHPATKRAPASLVGDPEHLIYEMIANN